jgi:hypothetical protein
MYRPVIFTVATLLSAATAVYAVPPARGTPAKSDNPRERIVCRTFLDTGSLVRSTRTCKTRREWDADAANLRAASSTSDSCRNEANGGQC